MKGGIQSNKRKMMTQNNPFEYVFQLPKGSLYTPFPVPAYQALARAGEHNAQKVLLALISFMGKKSNVVYPSYSKIAMVAGIGRSSVSEGLKVLLDFGFIKYFKFPKGIEARNKYFLQYSCWNTSYMNEKAKSHKKVVARCFACNSLLARGEYASSPLGKVHWGCGGFVYLLNTPKSGRNK